MNAHHFFVFFKHPIILFFFCPHDIHIKEGEEGRGGKEGKDAIKPTLQTIGYGIDKPLINYRIDRT